MGTQTGSVVVGILYKKLAESKYKNAMCLKPELKKMDLLFEMNCYTKVFASLVIAGMVAVLSGCSGRDKNPARDKNVDPKVQKLKVLPDFYADHLYSPGENEQGSWVAMAFDDKGRMIACDQYGYLYRLHHSPSRINC